MANAQRAVPAKVLVGLGANVGDPAAQLADAVRRLGALGRVAAVSSLYRTAPVGPVAQPDFVNAVCLLETTLSPDALLEGTHGIEQSMGRVRGERYGPRRIDLDLLDYEGVVCASERLTLPHPELPRRAFVLAPLAEVDPGWRHPLDGRTAGELLGALENPERVERLGPLEGSQARNRTERST